MAEHTPTPYELSGSASWPRCPGVPRSVWTGGSDMRKQKRICIITRRGAEESNANAEFIVRACNSHDALVAACKRLDKFQIEYDFITCGGGMPGNDTYSSMLLDIVKEARAALAAAEPKGERNRAYELKEQQRDHWQRVGPKLLNILRLALSRLERYEPDTYNAEIRAAIEDAEPKE